MKKKDEIRYLKREANILKSKLHLFQANETNILFLINENTRLTKKLKETSEELNTARGIIFNYQTDYLAH